MHIFIPRGGLKKNLANSKITIVIGSPDKFVLERETITMHMADALLAPAVAATMYAASTVTAGASIVKLNREEKLDHELAAKNYPRWQLCPRSFSRVR